MQNIDIRLGSSEIATIIRNEISSGELSSRQRLPPERSLAEKHGVARGTVREALNQLEKENLVEIRPGSGTYVASRPDDETNHVIANARPLELIDARFALEPHMCRLAVLHATSQDFNRMEELLTVMELPDIEPSAFSRADTAFHNRLAESTGNSLLIWMLMQINSVRNQQQWAQMRSLTINPAVIEQYNFEHRNIFNAIRNREPEQAANHMKKHLETARLTLTRSSST